LNGGASYRFELSNVTNNAAWDRVNINGALAIAANSGSPFTIKVVSLTSINTPGLAGGFDPSLTYTWALASATSLSGYDASAFILDTTGFINAFSGTFSVTNVGNTLAVKYAGAPSTRPVLLSGAASAGASYTLTFAGLTGQSYHVLATNRVNAPLATWPVLTNGTFSGGGGALSTNTFIDPGVITNAPRRFYIITSP
jgi:hypothetical protein